MTNHAGGGRLIAGRYRLAATPLGRGGMGVVWRARDELLGREVAVKELHIDASLPADDAWQRRERTLREARAVAQIKHPHVVVVHDVVVDDEHPFIVMELIEGGSLADRLARHGPLGTAEAAELCLAVLGALRAAHARGVLHRDLKPGNVLLEAGTGRAVLSDFGIAQVAGASTLTESGSFVGSPEYTAPERMSGARAGPASDLWSLGVLLCAALSGRSPFQRDSLSAMVHAVVLAEIRPPPQAGPLLPVVRGLLERDPERRIDAAQTERLLRAYVATGALPRQPTPAPHRPAVTRSAVTRRLATAWHAVTPCLPARLRAAARGEGARGEGLRDPDVRRPGTRGADVRGAGAGGAGLRRPGVRAEGVRSPAVWRLGVWRTAARWPSRRRSLLVAVLVAVVAAAGISAVVLLLDRDGDRDGDPGGGDRTGTGAPPAATRTYPLTNTANGGKCDTPGHGSVTGLELAAPRAVEMDA
ncbi:serine/threonine-protein kinase [Streptomyces sp. O3]